MRRAKIVATVGPATSRPEAMHDLLSAGADVVRLNAAHGTAAEHAQHATLSREAAGALGRSVGVLVDLPGPKMRWGPVVDDEIRIETGDLVAIVSASPGKRAGATEPVRVVRA